MYAVYYVVYIVFVQFIAFVEHVTWTSYLGPKVLVSQGFFWPVVSEYRGCQAVAVAAPPPKREDRDIFSLTNLNKEFLVNLIGFSKFLLGNNIKMSNPYAFIGLPLGSQASGKYFVFNLI